MKLFFLLLLCTLTATRAHADPRADVQSAFAQVLAAGGFRAYAQGHLFGPQLPAMSADVDIVFPDRIHARTDEMEFIALPNRAWIRTFGIWTATDRSLLPVTSFDRTAMRQAIASIHDARIEGASKTSQCAAHVYRFRAGGKLPGASANGDLRAWLCDGSNRIARLQATDANTGERVILDFDWSRRAAVGPPRD
ncbi:MAG: hypothetical protein ACREPT_08200 [Rudaea sp.]